VTLDNMNSRFYYNAINFAKIVSIIISKIISSSIVIIITYFIYRRKQMNSRSDIYRLLALSIKRSSSSFKNAV